MHTEPMKRTVTHGMSAVALTVCAVEPAYAYLDPGTGNSNPHAVPATVAGALASLKPCEQEIRFLFKPMFGRNPERSSVSESEAHRSDDKAN